MFVFYHLFRQLHTEWAVYSAILAWALFLLVGPEGKARLAPLYALGNFLTIAVILPLVDRIPYTPLFSTQGSSIWIFYLLFLANCTIWLALCFRHRLAQGLLTCLYDLSFIVLAKFAFSPFYSMEESLGPTVYAIWDMVHLLVLSMALILLAQLFLRVRLDFNLGPLPRIYGAIFLIPWTIVLIFTLLVSGNAFLWSHAQQILAATLVLLLPLIYYLVASGTAALAEGRQMEKSLLETRATLEHYRGVLELEETIRQERHELKNRYLHIQILLKERRLEELDDYLAREIGSRMEAISAVLSGNIMIDYILALKQKETQELHIPFLMEVALCRGPLPREDQICTILLNLLDNSIEASLQEASPKILLSLKSQGGYLILKVQNRISQDILMINPTLATTKKDRARHGQGLKIVRRTVREAAGMLDISTSKGFFEVAVALPIRNDQEPGRKESS